MSDYQPIACELYDRYEVAILHHQQLRLTWRDDADVSHIEVMHPLDLQTREGCEYLAVRNQAGERLDLRLDRISAAEPV